MCVLAFSGGDRTRPGSSARKTVPMHAETGAGRRMWAERASRSRLGALARRKEGRMATQGIDDHELGPADYLERALEDLNRARQETEAEAISMIDSAVGRLRQALARVQGGAEDRAEHLKALAEDRAAEWQRMLEDASDDARQELAIRSVHAQRSREALKAISKEVRLQKKEIRRQKKEVAASR